MMKHLGLLALCWSAMVQAQPSSEADRLFREARTLLANEKYAEACVLLQDSQRLEPALGTLLNLADCLEKTGKRASAFIAFNQASAWATRNNEAKRAEVALHRAQVLKPQLAFVAVELAAFTPQAVAVLRQQEAPPEVVVVRWTLVGATESIPVDAGKYSLTVEAPGRKPHTELFEVGERQSGLLLLKVPVLDGLPGTPAADAQEKNRAANQRTGIVSTAIGGALVILGGVGVGYSRSVLDRVERELPGGPDAANPTVTRSQYATVRTLFPASWVVMAVGITAVGLGVFTLGRDSSSSVSLHFVAAPDSAFASVSGTF